MSSPDVNILWGYYDNNPQIDSRVLSNQAKQAVEVTLSRPFLNKTLSALNPSLNQEVLGVSVRLIQQGFKNNIFLVNASLSDSEVPFVLVQAKSGDGYNQQLIDDFHNLLKLRVAMISAGITPFVPQTCALNTVGTQAFSDEFFPKHDEVNPLFTGIRVPNNEPYIALIANAPTPDSETYNSGIRRALFAVPHFTYPECTVLHSVLKDSFLYKKSEQFKTELIARLYVVRQLMEGLPREFSISAGDFMANFDWRVADFDLKLITIRGGWESVSENSFTSWIRDYRDLIRIEGSFPNDLFENFHVFEEQNTLLEGIRKGKRLLSKKMV